jgi:type II restriction/modification system DNA methylase subunit YeeA
VLARHAVELVDLLFEERLRTPAFDTRMRQLLIDACTFSWEAISPAIFGSLFQSVMNKNQRLALGAHYTTEKNILNRPLQKWGCGGVRRGLAWCGCTPMPTAASRSSTGSAAWRASSPAAA